MRRFVWALAALLLCAGWAKADTPIAVFKSFRGNINFAGTERTIRTAANADNPCSVYSSGTSVTSTVAGIPSGATVISAQLYWAGSGTTGDYTVTFEGTSITADKSRQYTSTTIGAGYTYFSGAADVTAQVTGKTGGPNGTYTFSGLTVNTGDPWCSAQGVLGGYALVIVYSNATGASPEPFRMLNIYEGFQYFRNSSLTINLGNFNVPNPVPANAGRLGHITWEGDATLSQGGEDVTLNGTALTDSLNPSGNQFNSVSNVITDKNGAVVGDKASYGIDFDVYGFGAPTIASGQSSATAVYTTGQDMVILSAEVVAMPYVANADLALTMTRSGDLVVGSTATYTLNVSNVGTDVEQGPVTVVDTLPAGLTLASTSGSNWVCAKTSGSGGTTIVTCTQNLQNLAGGTLAPNGALAPLTLKVTPTTSGNFTNTATVSGKTGDNNSANNTATNTGTAAASSGGAYGYNAVFTRDICTNGQTIIYTDDVSSSTCRAFVGPVVAGGSTSVGNATNIYLTAVSGSGAAQKAVALSGSDTTVPLDFSATCLPNSGKTIAYAGLTLDCKGTWQTINVTIKGNQTNGANIASFVYNDVGQVTLSLRYSGVVLGNATFVSRPYDVQVRAAVRSDGYALTDNAGDAGFTKSGDTFTLRVGAVMADGKSVPPSFGKEGAAISGATDTAKTIKLDLFTANPLYTPIAALADKDSLVQAAFVTTPAWSLNAGASGGVAYDASVNWFEAGYLAVTPSLTDYLGTGSVGGATATARIVAGTRIIGRFYPDHFVTEVNQNFDCAASMNCPAAYDASKPAYPVSGGTYSTQPFGVTVTPYGLPLNGKPQQLFLYQNVSGTAGRALQLSAVTMANNTAAAALGGFALTPGKAFPYSISAGDFPLLTDTGATFTLASPYVTDAKPPLTLSAPQFFYVRAKSVETVVGTTASTVTINSVAAAGTQYEDGLLAVVGRLQVANAFGSELLRLPVPLTAQYWTGSAWMTNTAYSDAAYTTGKIVANVDKLQNCTKTLASSGTTCKANIITAVNSGAVTVLTNGKGVLTLQAPARPNAGSVDYIVPGTPSWLPSTRARATFGIYKAPIVYLREVY